MNSWLRKRVLVFTGTLHLWDIDGRIQKLDAVMINAVLEATEALAIRN